MMEECKFSKQYIATMDIFFLMFAPIFQKVPRIWLLDLKSQIELLIMEKSGIDLTKGPHSLELFIEDHP